MAFKIGTTEPENITYNGNEVKVVNYNGTNVWGKPYTSSLTKSTGSGASAGDAFILRQSSQYEHASPSDLTTPIQMTGTKNVYYGDVIVVRFTCPEGSKISSATVSNNGQSVAVTKLNDRSYYTNFFTVNGNISCSMATVSDISWQTLWEGQSSTVIRNQGETKNIKINVGRALNSNWKYRITAYCVAGLDEGMSTTISQDSMPYEYLITFGNRYTFNSISVDASEGSAYYNLVVVNATATAVDTLGSINITKIEAYY